MRFLRRPKPEPAVRVTPWGIGAVILLIAAAVASWLAQPDPPEEEGESETTKDKADSGDDPPPAFRPRGYVNRRSGSRGDCRMAGSSATSNVLLTSTSPDTDTEQTQERAMSQSAYRDHKIKVGLTVSIVALALTTAVIHYTIGGFGSLTGLMFYGNAAAYAFLAGALVAPIAIAQRYAFLTRLALAGVAAATIGGWVLFGARYDVAYLSKAIEVALIAVSLVATYRDRHAILALVQDARRRLPFGRVTA